mmetsp:Transcript_29449/g.85677  ORF Transcript_29449/g.85677 Transcript_29449/m.85677 type:complete len:200 (-) Transcript_29449:291-890(-)
MITPFSGCVPDNTALLQQIRGADASRQQTGGDIAVMGPGRRRPFHVELQSGELAKSAGIVIAHGLGIAKGLKDGIALQDPPDRRAGRFGILVLPGRGVILWPRPLDGGQVRHDDLHGLGLSGTRFTTNKDRLIALVDGQSAVGQAGGFVNVRIVSQPIVIRPVRLGLDGGCLAGPALLLLPPALLLLLLLRLQFACGFR